MSNKLKRSFFKRDTLTVAQELLGKYLVRMIDGEVLVGKIVETEAYIGEDDLACHASRGRTPRTEIMYGKAGYAYIYMIYGMYYCLNIVTERTGFPAAVLIRAVEPLVSTGLGIIRDKKIKIVDLRKMGSGPGKLCRWMKISKDLNGEDIVKSSRLFIVDKLSRGFVLGLTQDTGFSDLSFSQFWKDRQTRGEKRSFEIVSTKRVGVDYAKHCTRYPWRFYIKDNNFVSKK